MTCFCKFELMKMVRFAKDIKNDKNTTTLYNMTLIMQLMNKFKNTPLETSLSYMYEPT